MGFLEENGNSSVYKNLTKPDNTKTKQVLVYKRSFKKFKLNFI